jgi:hypothetical protein
MADLPFIKWSDELFKPDLAACGSALPVFRDTQVAHSILESLSKPRKRQRPSSSSRGNDRLSNGFGTSWRELERRFHGKTYAVPGKFVINLLDQRSLFAATSYAVESSVPVEVFGAFVVSLQTQRKVSVTKENAASLSLLAKEFFLSDLLSECRAFSFDIVLSLVERVSVLERQTRQAGAVEDRVERQEEGLESLNCRFEKLGEKLSKTEVLIGGEESGRVKSLLSLREGIEKLIAYVSEGSSGIAKLPASPPKAEKSVRTKEFPLEHPASLEGIISYLTQEHSGNVHEKGIVTITSKSVGCDDPAYALTNVANLTSGCHFISRTDPGQWVCWDFREMRVRPTHYSIYKWRLKSWVVEGSLDGKNWTEMDRKTDNQDFKDTWNTVSFALSPVECRFIRLTQTDKNHGGNDYLYLFAVEFFGTLSE